MNALSQERQSVILRLLVEGNSIRSTERITGSHRDTIMRLLVKAGQQAKRFLDETMVNLKLKNLQLDEIWTYCGKKQRQVTLDDPDDKGDQYLFLAFDRDTKLIPSYLLGKRTEQITDQFIEDLATRVKVPDPHQDPDWRGARPSIFTDGFPAYKDAINWHFGLTASYGILIKDQVKVPGSHPQLNISRTVVRGNMDESDICTSHIERHNATIRLFIKRFNRRTLAFSKKLKNLKAAISLHVAYYNFCWRPRTTKITPAASAGVCSSLWSLDKLLGAIQDFSN